MCTCSYDTLDVCVCAHVVMIRMFVCVCSCSYDIYSCVCAHVVMIPMFVCVLM